MDDFYLLCPGREQFSWWPAALWVLALLPLSALTLDSSPHTDLTTLTSFLPLKLISSQGLAYFSTWTFLPGDLLEAVPAYPSAPCSEVTSSEELCLTISGLPLSSFMFSESLSFVEAISVRTCLLQVTPLECKPHEVRNLFHFAHCHSPWTWNGAHLNSRCSINTYWAN